MFDVSPVAFTSSSGPATDLSMRAKLIDQHALPDIIVHNLVTPQEVDKLFEM
jgi:hypothetical protein